MTREPSTLRLNSMEILEKMLDPKLEIHPGIELKFYYGIKGVMSILVRAALTKGVESAVEGWISVMEIHNNKRRPSTVK